MRLHVWMLGFALVLVGGCRNQSPESGSKPANRVVKVDPETALFEDYRAGLFQVDAGVASLEEALRLCQGELKAAKGDRREALLDVEDMLDSAGATLADASAPPPAKEEFQRDFKSFDEDRLKAVEKAVDALRETRNALGMVEQLAEGSTGAAKQALEDVNLKLEEALEATETAITSFGGKVPPEDEEAGAGP